MSETFHNVKKALGLYFKGQFILMIVSFFIFWVVLSVLKLENPLFFAALSGVLSVIPVFGTPVAAIIVFIASLLDNSGFSAMHPLLEGLVFVSLYLVFNQIIDLVLSPYIMGTALKLSPLALLFTVVAGTLIFGLAGTVLAVPVLIILRTIYLENSKINKR